MSQVKAKKHKTIYIERIEKYVFVTTLLVLVAGLAYAGYFFYTGKGWLLLERKETVSDFYFNRGLYYFNGGTYNLDTARGSFEEALAHSHGMYPFAYYQLSRIYFITGDFSSALIEADAELSAYPDHYRMHYVEGLIYGYRKQYIQAEEQFKLFIAQTPLPSWAGYNDLAWIYFSEGDYASAADATMQGLKVWPDSPWLQNSYAVAELNLGKYQIAESHFLTAQTLFASMTPAEWGRSYPGNSAGSYESGLVQTRAAIEQNLILVHTKLHD